MAAIVDLDAVCDSLFRHPRVRARLARDYGFAVPDSAAALRRALVASFDQARVAESDSEALESQLIIARQDFMDCPNCAHHALMQEAEALQKRGTPARGYVFYDEDGVVEAMEGNGVSLQFGSTGAAGDTECAIGQIVVETLEVAGFHPLWSGSSDEPIKVPLVWQRRVASQPSRPDTHPNPEAVAQAS